MMNEGGPPTFARRRRPGSESDPHVEWMRMSLRVWVCVGVRHSRSASPTASQLFSARTRRNNTSANCGRIFNLSPFAVLRLILNTFAGPAVFCCLRLLCATLVAGTMRSAWFSRSSFDWMGAVEDDGFRPPRSTEWGFFQIQREEKRAEMDSVEGQQLE